MEEADLGSTQSVPDITHLLPFICSCGARRRGLTAAITQQLSGLIGLWCARAKRTLREISRDKDWGSHFPRNSTEWRILFTCHLERFSKYTIFNPFLPIHIPHPLYKLHKPQNWQSPTSCWFASLSCPGRVPTNARAGAPHEILADKRHCDRSWLLCMQNQFLV